MGYDKFYFIMAFLVVFSVVMTYDNAIKKINSFLRFGVKPGLERISKLLKMMGNPQDKLKFVHVAGTNGKGSTCTFVSSILKNSGYNVGLFTSPFVTEFRERIQMNGKMIPKEDLVRILDYIEPMAESMSEDGEEITEFELITAIAFQWFLDMRCDVVVLEVGLGGRFDATNVIGVPLVSIIASISLDHTAILGETLSKIAYEKCGIIKNNGTTVVFPEQHGEAMNVIERISKERKNTLVIPNPDEIQEIVSNISETDLLYKGEVITSHLIGEHQKLNLLTALSAIDVLNHKEFNIPFAAIQMGTEQAKIPARLELLSKTPVVLLDGAHNPDGARVLSNAIKKYLSGKKVVAIMGMLRDKDSELALKQLAPHFDSILTVSVSNARTLTEDELAKEAKAYCDNVIAVKEKFCAVDKAMSMVSENDAVVVCGSLYLAGELRPVIIKNLDNRQKKL